jgi:hypothetical protein
MTIIIETTTLYSYSGVIVSTHGTISIPAVSVYTSPSFIPSNVEIPSNYAVVSASAVERCNAPTV